MVDAPTKDNHVDPLTWNIPIVDRDGRPTQEFQQKWMQQQRTNGEIPDLPAVPNDPTKFLNGNIPQAYAKVKDTDLAVSDVTGNNVSTAAHGFAPKAPNDSNQFLNGLAAYGVPPYPASALDDGTNFYLAMQDANGILILSGGSPIYAAEVLPTSALPSFPVGANPTATGGDVAINGVATNFMRSDGAFAIQKCSSTLFGLAKVDNVSIVATGGVVSVAPKFATTVFTASGTFTTPADSSTSTVYRVRMVAAGGGSPGNNSADAFYGTPGGGGGEYMEGTFTGVAPSTGITITINNGGAAGTNAPTSGGDGGTTVIGAPVSATANGGKGGLNVSAAAQAPADGGSGGTLPSGWVSIPGAPSGQGGLSSYGASAGAPGGASMLGFGGKGTINALVAGAPGQNYGGGAGGSRASGGGSVAGADGAKGIVIIQRVTV